MLRMALSALVAFMFALTMTGCGGELDGSYDENSVLGNGQGAGVAQGDAVGDGDGEGTGEAQGDGDGVPDGDPLVECEEGYVACACEEQLQEKEETAVQDKEEAAVNDQTALEDKEQLKVMDPEQCDGEPDQLKDTLMVNQFTKAQEKDATAIMEKDETQQQLEEQGCCCLVE